VCWHTTGNHFGFALLDSAAALIKLGTVPNDACCSALRTLLVQAAPSEILHVQGNLPISAVRCLQDPTLSAEVTVLAKEDVPAPAAAQASLQAQSDFQAVGAALKSMSSDPAAESLSALMGLLSHVRRMKLLSILSSCVQVPYPAITISFCSTSIASITVD
jgi:hypothetical protein